MQKCITLVRSHIHEINQRTSQNSVFDLRWANELSKLNSLNERQIKSLPVVVDPPQPIIAQWLASTRLGSRNSEQTKLLNWSDLGMLLGTTVCFPRRNANG